MHHPIQQDTTCITKASSWNRSSMAPTTTGLGTSPSTWMPTTDRAMLRVRTSAGTHQRRTPLTGEVVAKAKNCPTIMKRINLRYSVAENAKKQQGQARVTNVADTSRELDIASRPKTFVTRSRMMPPDMVPNRPVKTATDPKARSASSSCISNFRWRATGELFNNESEGRVEKRGA
eukprot:767893-Hanusia_phi.AAC.5